MPHVNWARPSITDPIYRTTQNDAKRFLLNALSDGPVPRAELVARARAEGISDSTLRRAQLKLRIKSQVVWSLASKCIIVEMLCCASPDLERQHGGGLVAEVAAARVRPLSQ
jgi:hypothetical protein